MGIKRHDHARQRKTSQAEYVFEACSLWEWELDWYLTTPEHFIAPALFADRNGRFTLSFLEALDSAGVVLPAWRDAYWSISRVNADGTKRRVAVHWKYGAAYDTHLLNGKRFYDLEGDSNGWF